MLTRTKLAIAAIAATAALGAGGAAYAATSGGGTPPAPAPKAAKPKTAKKARRVASIEGKVTSDSATGGAFDQGALSIVQPDGNRLTFSLRTATKAVRYQGVGVKSVAEPATGIPTGEVVVVRAVRGSGGQWVARRVLDSGFAAA